MLRVAGWVPVGFEGSGQGRGVDKRQVPADLGPFPGAFQNISTLAEPPALEDACLPGGWKTWALTLHSSGLCTEGGKEDSVRRCLGHVGGHAEDPSRVAEAGFWCLLGLPRQPPSECPRGPLPSQVPGGSAVREQREAARRRGLSFQSALQVVRLHRVQYSEE